MTTDIEEELYDDIDTIASLANQALGYHENGDDIKEKYALELINEIAESWEDP
jgi:hypothetical protein